MTPSHHKRKIFWVDSSRTPVAEVLFLRECVHRDCEREDRICIEAGVRWLRHVKEEAGLKRGDPKKIEYYCWCIISASKMFEYWVPGSDQGGPYIEKWWKRGLQNGRWK